MSKRISEFFDNHFNVLFYGTIGAVFISVIAIGVIRSHVSYYLDKGYKPIYQNTNPINNVTHVTLNKGHETVYCVGYLLPDNKTLIDSKCDSKEH